MEGAQARTLLILTDWFEPGYKAGGPIRSCVNLVSALEQEYNVMVITSDRDFGDSQPYPEVVKDSWQNTSQRTRIWYCSREKLSYAYLKEIIHGVSADIIYLNSMYSVPFTCWPLWMKFRSLLSQKFVLAPRGMLHPAALSYKKNKKKIFLSFFKALGLHRIITFHATNAKEEQDIRKIMGSKITVKKAPNVPSFQQAVWKAKEKNVGELKMVMIARIAANKNIAFLLKAMKDLPEGVSLDIIGPLEDKDYWQQCLQILENHPHKKLITYLGELPYPEIQKRLKQYHLFVLPTEGENFGHAIFEALQNGLPVLISDQTPWRSLTQDHAGWDISLDKPNQFVEAINMARSMDQKEYDLWSKSAWDLAARFVKNSDFVRQYKEIFET